MKKFFPALAGLVLFCVLCGGAAAFYGLQRMDADGPLTDTKLILIERGKGAAAIAQILEDESVVSSALMFKALYALEKDKGSLKAGEYEMPAGVSMREALTMMREGRVYDRKITFAEGLTSYQIVQTLNASDVLGGEMVAEIPADGTLLPETYHFIKGDTRQSVIGQMTSAMERTRAQLWEGRQEGLPFTTIEEAVTLASIVEKETGVGDERAKVAGVFVNRLRRGMPMQSDPTVIYALTEGKIESGGQGPIGRRLLSKDLEIDSPYNTYRYPGLPPAPIANPGKESIAAVLNPEAHDFVYFVADGSGGHAFGRTLAEHNGNVARWRKLRRERGF